MANRKSIRQIGQQPPAGSRPLQPVAAEGKPRTGELPPQVDEKNAPWAPPPLRTLEDTGLGKLGISELLLKTLYFKGDMTGYQLQESTKLPFQGVLDSIVAFIKHEKLVEIIGSGGLGEIAFRYQISSKGVERALEALQKTQYANIAPVPLEKYIESVYAQNREKRAIREDDMRRVMQNLIVSKEMLDILGPAANSGTSIFLYGPPGNGKTTLSEAVGRVILGGDMWIPYAIDVDGQVIKMYDSVNHELSEDQTPVKYRTGEIADARWVRIKRPIIIVGGELNMANLDLTYDTINKFYEAPYQVKANGGMFLIDDFRRQQVKPIDLLNRWIVPLEKKYDFLTLANGRKIEMPFEVMIVFSTNMDPKDLVDDAFLRRIKYKILVDNPTEEQFRDLFELMCRIRKVPFSESGYEYLIQKWYVEKVRDLRFVHPRDLLSQMKDIANYMNVQPDMSNTLLIDRAAASYFVEL